MSPEDEAVLEALLPGPPRQHRVNGVIAQALGDIQVQNRLGDLALLTTRAAFSVFSNLGQQTIQVGTYSPQGTPGLVRALRALNGFSLLIGCRLNFQLLRFL